MYTYLQTNPQEIHTLLSRQNILKLTSTYIKVPTYLESIWKLQVEINLIMWQPKWSTILFLIILVWIETKLKFILASQNLFLLVISKYFVRLYFEERKESLMISWAFLLLICKLLYYFFLITLQFCSIFNLKVAFQKSNNLGI